MTPLLLASLTGSLLLPLAMGERVCILLDRGHSIQSASRATVDYYWLTLRQLSPTDRRTISRMAGQSSAEQCPDLWRGM